LALIDKPASTLDQQREKQTPVVAAADLEEHRRVPSVEARLQRVEEMLAKDSSAPAEKK
jgi:hypothetical protein